MASPWDNVDASFAANLRAMIAESGGKITVVSGYRSPERQQQLWGEALRRYGSEQEARKWVAPPGKSNHNKGLAFDLGGDIQLAHLLAPKYGLVFPMGHEPWHIEPAGVRSDPDAYTTDPNAPTQEDQATDGVFNTVGSLLGEKLFSNLDEQQGPSILNGGSTSALDAGATPTSSSTTASATQPNGSANTGTGGDIDSFMRAIGGQESGGNYNSVNGSSGASGKYQIMPANWPSWSREAGLGDHAAQTPENQEKVARFKMQQYYDQFGSWDKVAKAWYSGPGNVDKNVGGGAGYPDSDSYAKQVMTRMGGVD